MAQKTTIPELPFGTQVGRFKIMRLLGRGGMGEVYLARDLQLGRKVALKMIHPGQISPAARERFLFEARVTARFNHPHIITIYDVGEHEERPYVALAYLEGQTLRARLHREDIPLDAALRILLQVVEALEEAHSHELLHRDLKPENIFLCKDGRVQVLDFGLAKRMQSPLPGHPRSVDFDDLDLNRESRDSFQVVGTPEYMAPEQWRAARVTAATDVWALGVILHELLMGRRPYPLPQDAPTAVDPDDAFADTLAPTTEADLAAMMEETTPLYREFLSRLSRQITAPDNDVAPEPRPGWPEGLHALLGRCLDKDPQRRPTTAALAQAFTGYLAPEAKADAPALADNPFRGLHAFTERHAAFFFGRDAEIAGLMEAIREVTVLPIVGPSGVGKSSLVRAGLIPRLLGQGGWQILRFRPGSRPLRALAQTLLSRSKQASQGAISLQSPLAPRDAQESDEAAAAGDSQAAGDAATSRESAPGAVAPEPPGGEAPGPFEALEPPGGEAPEPFGDEAPESFGGEAPQSQAALVEALAQRWREAPSSLSAWLYAYAEELGCRLLLFVDQFEEIYTLVDDPQERQSFMQAICTAADDPQDPIRVVFTLRNDFLGRLTGSAEVRKALNQASILWAPDQQALEEMVMGPLARLGYGFDDPGLLGEMLGSIKHEPSALPLLQFAIHQMWERRDKQHKLLRRESYEAMGGVVGALAHHADTMLEGLTAEQIQQVRELMLRLVTGEGTRRVVSRQRLLEGLDAEEQLDRLVAARLLVARKSRSGGATDDAVIELAHEALLQTWERLSRWLHESHEERAFVAELEAAAALWSRRGSREEEVWRGEALGEALRMQARLATPLAEEARRFIEMGQSLERQQEATARRRRTLRLALLGAFSVVASLLALAFYGQKQIATEQHHAARQNLARSLREGAQSALAQHDALVARAKLRRSMEIHPTARARLLWHKLTHTSLLWQRIVGGGMLGHVEFSPDGSKLSFIRGPTKGPYTLDLLYQRLTPAAHLPQVQAKSVALGPGGKASVFGACGGRWFLLHHESRRVEWLPGHPGHTCITRVAFHPSGRWVGGATDSGTIAVFDRKQKRHWSVATGFANRYQRGFLFAPTPRPLVALHARRKEAIVWAPGEAKARTLRSPSRIREMAFHPSGRWVVTGHLNGKVHFWDAATFKHSRELQYGVAKIYALRFLEGGQKLLVVDQQGAAILWSVASGRVLWLRHTKARKPYFAALGPRGRFLVVGDWGYFRGTLATTVRLWDLHAQQAMTPRSGHYSFLWRVRFHPKKPWLLSCGNDPMVRIWDLSSGKVAMRYWLQSTLHQGLAVSADGRRLAVGGRRKIWLWDLHRHTVLHTWRGHPLGVKALTFSPDQDSLYSADYGRKFAVYRWSLARRGGSLGAGVYRERLLLSRPGWVWGATFSPRGDGLAFYQGKEAWLWDLHEGHFVRLPRRAHRFAWSPDGRTMATAASNKARQAVVRLTRLDAGEHQVVGRFRGGVRQLAFSPDGQKLLVSRKSRLFLLDLKTRTTSWIKGAFENGRLRFSPDGRLLASTNYGGLHLWRARDGAPVWWAPFFDRSHKQLLTHRGWEAVGPLASQMPPTRWRHRLRQGVFFAHRHRPSKLLCIQSHDDHLALWDTAADRRLYRRHLGPFEQLQATPAGCLVRRGPQVRLYLRGGGVRVLHREATLAAWDRGRWLVGHKQRVELLDSFGKRLALYKVQTPRRTMTSFRWGPGWLAVGFRHGNIELVPTQRGKEVPRLSFERTPMGAVSQLALGPSHTLIAGFWDGQVYAWDLRSGKMIFYDQLHGRIRHLYMERHRLHVTTVLGDHRTHDMGILAMDACALLRDIWERVPLTWSQGQLTPRPLPQHHPCAPKK